MIKFVKKLRITENGAFYLKFKMWYLAQSIPSKKEVTWSIVSDQVEKVVHLFYCIRSGKKGWSTLKWFSVKYLVLVRVEPDLNFIHLEFDFISIKVNFFYASFIKEIDKKNDKNNSSLKKTYQYTLTEYIFLFEFYDDRINLNFIYRRVSK